MAREVDPSFEWRPPFRTRPLSRSINPILISLVAGIGISLLLGPHSIITGGFYLIPVYLLFFPALVGFGLPGIVGLALVPVLTAVLIAGSLSGGIVTGMALLVVGILGVRLYRVQVSRSSRFRLRRVILVILGTTPIVAVLTAIGHEIVGLRPIYVGIQSTAVAFGAASLLSIPFVMWIDESTSRQARRAQLTVTDGLAAVILGWCWVGVAAIGSMGFHAGSQVPTYLYQRQGIEGVHVLFDTSIFGPGGLRVQIGLAAVALTLLWIVLNPRGISA